MKTSTIFKEGLLGLRGKLENIENQLEGQLKDIELRNEKWKFLDERARDVMAKQDGVIKFNVGGQKFQTRIDTLLNIKDTLFYKLVTSKEFDCYEEIFFDRSPQYFGIILDYLRYNTVNYKWLDSSQLQELRLEVDYYEINEISKYLEIGTGPIQFESFESSGPYSAGGGVVGTNKIEDLRDRSLNTGICSNPGSITIKLNRICTIKEIEIGGYGGSTYWSINNGVNAVIETSEDKVSWRSVGSLSSTYGNITNVKLTESKALFIRFRHTSYIGIGYLNIKEN